MNLTVEYQNSQADTGTASTIADNFVSKNVDLICAIATPSAMSAYNSCLDSEIPVVYTAEAFNCFAEQCDRFLTQAETGEPYDVNNMPQEPFAYAFWLVVCLAIGFVIALITASIKRSKLTSVVKRTTAEEYMKKDSLNLTVKQDRFINKVVTSRPVPKNDNDSHSGGGGSSTHVSSSGEVHGGHSGKF